MSLSSVLLRKPSSLVRSTSCIAGAMLLWMGSPPTASASVIFSDSTYNATDYTEAFNYNNAMSTSMFSTSSSGLQFSIVAAGAALGSTAVLTGELNTNFVYNPGTQGAISSISASAFKTFSGTNPTTISSNPNAGMVTFGNAFRPLVEQGGNYYTLSSSAVAFGPSLVLPEGTTTPVTVGPTTISEPSLTESDFVLIDPMTGLITTTGGLNFNGSALTFGLVQYLGTTPPPVTAETNYADFTIGITSVSAVPLPAALPVFGGGLLILTLVQYGRKRKLATNAS